MFFQKKGKDVLGGVISTSVGGHIIVLPAIELEHPDFRNEEEWTDAALIFTKRFLKSIIEIDKALVSQSGLTPAPAWLVAPKYEIAIVSDMEKKISEIEAEIEELQISKIKLQEEQELALLPKKLLFETGKPLEISVRAALKILGFSAESFEDGASEFDVIFRSEEGDFLGEVEGKDNKAIDVHKISQLMRNLGEYILKEGVSSPAKGVLFGNGYRVLEPQKRAVEFTEKCIRTSFQNNIALVRTSDLFSLIQFLSLNNDKEFKKKCRDAILSAKGGVVVFPEI